MIRVSIVSDGMAMIDGKLWVRAKARKANSCWVTKRPIRPGDIVFRPSGNGDNRMLRIRADWIEKAQP